MTFVMRARLWVALAVCTAAGCWNIANAQSAAALSWTDGEVSVTKQQRYATDQEYYQSLPSSSTGCVWQEVRLAYQPDIGIACVDQGGSFSLAHVPGGGYYLRIGSDSMYYRLQGSSAYSTYFIGPDDHSLVMLKQTSYYHRELSMINDVLSRLERVTAAGSSRYEYHITAAPDWQLNTKDGGVFPVNNVGISSNHRYVVVGRWEKGLVRIDLQTKENKAFSSDGGWQYSGGEVSYGISNDGKTFVKAGRDSGYYVQALSDACGATYIEDIGAPSVLPCPAVDIAQKIQTTLGLPTLARHTWYVSRVDDDMSVELTPQINTANSYMNSLIVTPAGYRPNHLKYLALGDSFSSGEGDIEKNSNGQKYYRAWTDTAGPPEERCHISTRSYPYQLANSLSLNLKTDWQMVACSGAIIGDDYMGSGEYWGQNGRLKDQKDRQDLKNVALNDFIPGRDRQVEFVKKYKPTAITLTGSGNDVGFAKIITACVSPLDANETCAYANDDHKMSIFASAISAQYYTVRTLIKSIRAASPSTKIYYLGYPQFLSATGNTCGLSVELSQTERTVFRDAVGYLNDVIEAAALSEGATYIDIEDVFGASHELCGDGERYANGFNLDCASGTAEALRMFAGSDRCQESFHPNAKGHQVIANRIKYKVADIVDSQACVNKSCVIETPLSSVEIPDVFERARSRDAQANRVEVHNGNMLAIQKGNPSARIKTQASGMEPNSSASAYITSTPIQLGTYDVDSRGQLSVSIDVPNSLEVGYHTLHILGKTFSGENMEIWQLVQVVGRDGDIDEDGIPDALDKCYRYKALGIDRDHDAIDDGCDSFVQPQDNASGSTPDDQTRVEIALLANDTQTVLPNAQGARTQTKGLDDERFDKDVFTADTYGKQNSHADASLKSLRHTPRSTVPSPSTIPGSTFLVIFTIMLGTFILILLAYAVTKKYKK